MERLTSNGITRSLVSHIQVTVENGKVVLAGNVDRASQVVEAERIANATDGVRTVENTLALRSRPGASYSTHNEQPQK